MTYRVGIDIGGTFTDFALLKGGPDGNEAVLHKNLSTPEDRSLGVMEGLGKLAEKEGLDLTTFLSRCDAIVHGTTVADNTLIEMNGALTGLITTEGFRDEIEYRRGYKEDIWDVRLAPPVQITPRRRRLTVPERVLHDGTVHKVLDEAAVRDACARLRKQGVESLAVSLLFAHVNSAHEKRVGEIAAEELPGVSISLSHEVLPRAPEYDRTSTTVVNAFVAPRVRHYLEALVTRLRDGGYANQLMVMQASGGVMSVDYIAGSPIRVLASGPAGGVIGSAHVGKAKGMPITASCSTRIGASAMVALSHSTGRGAAVIRAASGDRKRCKNSTGTSDTPVSPSHVMRATEPATPTEVARRSGGNAAVSSCRWRVTGWMVASSWAWSRSHSHGYELSIPSSHMTCMHESVGRIWSMVATRQFCQ